MEHLQQLSRGVVLLERTPINKTLLEALLLRTHSFKGSAAIMGFKRIESILHKIEDGLEAMTQGDIQVEKKDVDVFLEALDIITALLDGPVVKGPGDADPVDRVCQALEDIVASGFDIAQKTEEQKPIPEKPRSPVAPPRRPQEIWSRVETGRLDHVVNLASDVFVAIHRIRDLITKFSSQLKADPQLSGKFDDTLQEFREFGDDVQKLSKRLQDEVLTLRMSPVTYLFDPYVREIRDLSHQKGKDVVVNVSGGEMLWDKAIMDRMREPILHLLRNALDHGIEAPEEREKRGKSRVGEIQLSVSREGGQVVLEVRDDGAGISVAQVRAVALHKGLVSLEQIEAFSDEQIHSLLFLPGFSTKGEVSELSGRGVGLNVVRDEVLRLKGRIEVESREGRGTRFVLRLPLTLAITETFLIKSGAEIFAIPVENIVEIMRVDPQEIRMESGREVCAVRGQSLPLIRLDALLKLPRQGLLEKHRLPMAVVQSVNSRAGILFDEILGRQPVICKSLGEWLGVVPFVFGATILNNGRVGLVLDIHQIINSLGEPLLRPAVAELEKGSVQHKKKILVVDDIFIAVQIAKDILASVGYEVVTARNGKEGLECALQENFDAIITDIVMPEMDGIAMITALRQEKEYREVPIIVLTTRQNEEDKRRGMDAGADAYLSKGDFSAPVLVETLERLLG